MNETIDLKKVRWELRKRELKEKAMRSAQKVSDFMKENRETLMVVVPAAAVGIKGLTRGVSSVAKRSAVKHEIKDRQTRFYDHRLGQYWHTKRPLKANEQLEVSRRRAAGESYGDIFRSMRLLK